MINELKKYQIEKTRPDPYLDETGSVVNGFSVRVRFTAFDEVHEIQTPDLKPDTVKNLIEDLLSQREAISDLG